jgi:hypothetical protein
MSATSLAQALEVVASASALAKKAGDERWEHEFTAVSAELVRLTAMGMQSRRPLPACTKAAIAALLDAIEQAQQLNKKAWVKKLIKIYDEVEGLAFLKYGTYGIHRLPIR